jgi:glycosyltransferase involved in cell wall biosynthesis
MADKKVLIITYYWPPSGGIAVQRWVKFVKYLRGFGWEPVVYTVSNGDYQIIDKNLEGEVPEGITVIRRPIWEPYKLYRIFTKSKASEGNLSIKLKKKAGLAARLSLWMRSNVFIPDARRFWIKPSIRFLKDYLSKNPVGVVVSTGPPHSLHVIGLEVARSTGIPWVADFRDPWTSMDYYHDLRLTAWADGKHHALERAVLREARAVIAVGRTVQKEFEEKRGNSVTYIPNGFDPSDFGEGNVILDNEFTLVHAGSFFERRNPVSLWRALALLRDESHPVIHQLKIRFIGRVDPVVLDSLAEHGLMTKVESISHVPHLEAVRFMQSARVLLLPIDDFAGSKWVLTGKLFEYLAARRPILCVGPVDGDAADVIEETQSGKTFDFKDVEGLKKYIENQWKDFESNRSGNITTKADQYSRKELTKRLAHLLDEITS